MVIVACSDSSDEPAPSGTDSEVEAIKKLDAHIAAYLYECGDDITYEDIIRYAQAYNKEVTAAVIDSVLYLYTPGNYQISIDLYGEDFDRYNMSEPEDITAILDSIDYSLGLVPDSLDENSTEYDDYYSVGDDNSNIVFEPVSDDEEEEEEYTTTRASTSTANYRVLSKQRILYWDPWATDPEKTVLPHIKKVLSRFHDKTIQLQYCIGSRCTPKRFSHFRNADIVFFATHGDPQGFIYIPEGVEGYEDYLNRKDANGNTMVWKGYFKNDRKYRKGYAVGQRFLEMVLPDLSRTIFWTSVCYGGKGDGQLHRAVYNKNAPLFVGGTNEVTDGISLRYFAHFIANFYSGVRLTQTMKNYSQRGVVTNNRLSWSYSLSKLDNQGRPTTQKEYGNFTMHFYREACFMAVKPLPTNININSRKSNGQLRYRVRGDKKPLAIRVSRTNGTRADTEDVTIEDYEDGIVVRNLNTGVTTYIPYTEATMQVERTYTNDEIAVVTFSAPVNDLPTGNYAYTSYIKNDNVTTLSDRVFYFSVDNQPEYDGYIDFEIDGSLSFSDHGTTYGGWPDYNNNLVLSGDGFKFVGFDYNTDSLVYRRGYVDGYENGLYHTFTACSPQGKAAHLRLLYRGTLSEIGECAFRYTNYTGHLTITVPETVKRIGYQAFYNIYTYDGEGELTINLPDGLEEIGDYSFSAKGAEPSYPYRRSLLSIHLKHIQLPSTLRRIGSCAFAYCDLEELSLPESVTEIGSGAFRDCLITDLYLGPQLKLVDWGAFTNCPLHSVRIDTPVEAFAKPNGRGEQVGTPFWTSHPSGPEHDNTYQASVTVTAPWTFVPNSFFSGVRNLTDVTLPSSVTSIGYGAFSGTPIKSISLPEGLTEICANAFAYTKLKSIKLPNGIKTLCGGPDNGSVGAFAYTDITSVELPDGIENINGAFQGTKIQSITIPASVRYGYFAFAGTPLTTAICLPKDPGWCITWTFPAGVTLYVPAEALNSYKMAFAFQDITVLPM